MRQIGWLLAVVVSIGAGGSAQVLADNWPQFRGVKFDGVAQSSIPQTWDATTHVKWKIDLAGEGWSCPVVWGDQVFVTAAIREGAANARPEPYRGGGGRRRSDLTKAKYRWEVICLDAKTGEVEWRRVARTGQPSIPRHGSNTFATETPATDGERVYAYFGMTGLYCYDLDGKLQWDVDLGSYEMRAGWGTSSSPVLFDGKLFLQIDNEQQSFIVAIDAQTGKQLWRVDRDEPSQYSSPIIWQNSQRSEVIAGGRVCRSYDPATGRLLWELDMSKGRSSATPLAVGDRLYVGTELRNRGGSDDGGGYLFAVKPGGTGDITPKPTAESNEYIAWRISESGIQMASPILCAGHLYLLERRSSILHCVNADTGATAYRKRISGARAFWASPWTSDGKVFCLDDSGTTFVLAGGPEYKLLASNVIGEQAWSSPAIAGNALYLRTVKRLYCITN